ncbi:transcription factor HES-5-like isoform X1 [Ambystoma mexicanum]|uniref:transcription factor HES-5-like isoform X1 n=1 Tax=Ambystoma mexicanum TaxID=8296 RepID=UPI0037E8DFED
MAPFCPLELYGQELEGRGIRKLRKPAVEKMRRERINSSIEQLRMLLQREFGDQELPPKAEKADILEMAVRVLAQRVQTAAPAVAASEGYSRCLQDSLHFLSLHGAPVETQVKLLDALHRPAAAAEAVCPSRPPSCPSSTKEPALDTPSAPWRPW